MKLKFGIAMVCYFLRSVLSKVIVSINPAVLHDIEKYLVLKKVHCLSAIEDMDGDYLEFGTGISTNFSHSIRCCISMAKQFDSDYVQTKFFGFDSFDAIHEHKKYGFNEHHFFLISDSQAQDECAKAAQSKITFKLIRGSLKDSLAGGLERYHIEKIRIIFIDSDTYLHAAEIFQFCMNAIQLGTFIVLDDYFAHRGSIKNGVKKAFDEFVKNYSFSARKVFDYGIGGVVYLIHATDEYGQINTFSR